MNFISLKYILFLPLAVFIYRLCPKKLRTALLLAMSLFFYGCFGIKYPALLSFVTLLSYLCALAIERFEARKKLFVVIAALGSLLPLLFFKYAGLIPGIGGIALPVGLSFYSFQALGYVIDVYRGDAPEKNILRYALFVAFFPQLGSGPIGRSRALLPQYKNPAPFSFTHIRDGITPILWGFFKKLVIADRMAAVVATVYSAPTKFAPVEIGFATVLFAIQIYCDFSAYTDIARGSAKLFGIDLALNFDAPYLASSVRDFWRRWHISLTSWFRDYLYFPLGGSRKGKWRTRANTLAVFAVSGLWHGSSLTYLIWGLLNGLYLVVLPGKKEKKSPISRLLGIALTFILVTVAWVFFRAESLYDSLYILKQMASFPLNMSFSPAALGIGRFDLVLFALSTIILTAADVGFHSYGLEAAIGRRVFIRYGVWFFLLCSTLLLGAYGAGFTSQVFLYFNF